jgi:hypothetical protein
MISEGMVIHVKSRHGVDPYLIISMPRSMKGWQKKWFYLRNDASTRSPCLPVATLFPCLPGELEWLGRTLANCIPCARPFSACGRKG